ncbi:MAG: hypothetical protein FJY82_11085 [Candidatus Aminicenantes bacterium]|nr:hypothetical protein [Candidatus Aminicenantes bacterium]
MNSPGHPPWVSVFCPTVPTPATSGASACPPGSPPSTTATNSSSRGTIAWPFSGRPAAVSSWYGRYFVDQPVDKAVPFRAGADFKFDYDLGLKFGLNTVGAGSVRAGAELRVQANAAKREGEALAFLEFGARVAVRPFFGLRKIMFLAGGPPPPDPFRRKLSAGVSLHSWFD